MKSKKIWVCLAMILLACGAILCGAGFGLGGSLQDSYGVHYGSDGFGVGFWDSSSDKVSDIPSSDTTPSASFSHLRMDIAMGNIEIKQGDRFFFSTKNISDEDYQVINENDTLVITSSSKHHDLFHLHDDIAFVLTIPSDRKLTSAEITSHMGEVEIHDVAIQSLYVDQDMGDIEIKNISCDDMTLDQAMGDIDVKGISLGNMDIKNDMGDIDVTLMGQRELYSYDLQASMGDIELNDREASGVSPSIKGGSENARYHISLHNNMGDISLEFDDDFD